MLSRFGFILFIFCALLAAGCAKGFRGLQSASLASSQCPSPSKLKNLKSESVSRLDPFATGKVQISSAAPDSRYIATVNLDCLKNADFGFSTAAIRAMESDPAALARQAGMASVLVSVNDEMDRQSLESQLAQEECVMGLSDNVVIKRLALPNDPQFAEQTHLNAVNYGSAYDFFDGSLALRPFETIVIAIIDDGINLQHPDLKPNIWTNPAELNGMPGVDDDGNGFVDDVNGYDFASGTGDPSHKAGPFHGSHVAGLAAAATNNGVGIAGVISRQVRLMALNIFGSDEGASIEDIDTAIRYAADNGAHVINMSLGGQGRSASTAAALQYAVDMGVTIVAAAGNDGSQLSDNVFFTPASYAPSISGMISVGATDASNASALCDFSNFSPTVVEVAAPGCDSSNLTGLISTLSGSGYARYNGTSMASPIVAGAAALASLSVKARTVASPNPATVERLILQSASSRATLSTSIKSGAHLDLGRLATQIGTDYPISSANDCSPN